MALNVDQLRTGLESYRETLQRQRLSLQDEHRDLQKKFDALFAVYGGRLAEEFHHRWAFTSKWFEKYAQRSAEMDRFLEERIEQLRNL